MTPAETQPKTISAHNGHQAHRAHNIRLPYVTSKEPHIDPTLQNQNEILIDEEPRQAYLRLFGEALEEYNSKQVRPERRIADYYDHIRKDVKKHPVYEMIIQVGDRNDTGINPAQTQTERAILKEFIAGWKTRNPNLELIGAYLHADETDGTVHAHLDYIPVARGYKNGLSVQTALVKALEQQGIEKGYKSKDTAQIHWEKRENAELERICNAHGIEVYHPLSGRKHEDTAQYKINQELRESGEQVQEQFRELEALKRQSAEISSKIKKNKKEFKELKREIENKKCELLETKGRILSAQEVQNSEEQKNLFGKAKENQVISLSELRSLRKTAVKVKKTQTENNELKERDTQLTKEVKEILKRVNERGKKLSEKEKYLSSREQTIENREKAVERGQIANLNAYTRSLENFCEREIGKEYFEEFRKKFFKSRDIGER